MAITPFHSVLTSTDGGLPGGTPIATYTVPAGKYAVFNAFHAGNIQGNLYLNDLPLSDLLFMTATLQQPDYRYGPFVANGGDVLSARFVTNGKWDTNSLSINGFLFDTSATRLPFTARLLENSTTYTVPSLRYAVFSIWNDNRSDYPSYFLLGLNGKPLVGAGVPPGGTANTATMTRRGPMIAKAGDVLAMLHVTHLIGPLQGPANPTRCILNGLLYSTSVVGGF